MPADTDFHAPECAWAATDGTTISIRPIRPSDEPALARFEATVSADSIYRRYGEVINKAERLSHRYLAHLCCTDPQSELSLLAIDGSGTIAGLGQLVRESPERAEFALLVADAYQRRGIGTRLLRALIEAARAAGVGVVEGFISAANAPMLRACRKLGFAFANDGAPSAIVATLALRPQHRKPAPKP